MQIRILKSIYFTKMKNKDTITFDQKNIIYEKLLKATQTFTSLKVQRISQPLHHEKSQGRKRKFIF